MANALFVAGPSAYASAPPSTGAQAPVNLAPAGSPLASPAGLGIGIPGTPIPQGLAPGVNLLPAAPTTLASLAHRAPALQAHALAGNGLPDIVLTQMPAYEPRFGGSALGTPQALSAPTPGVPSLSSVNSVESTPRAANVSPFYFVNEHYGHPSPTQAAPAAPQGLASAQAPTTASADTVGAPALARPPANAPSGEPQYYFVHAPQPFTRANSAYGAPEQHTSHAAGPHTGTEQHPAFDVHAVRRDFPILRERVHGQPLVWLDNAATTHKPQSVIERIAHFYQHENSNIHRAAHELAARATDAYEGARERVKNFIHAPDVNEVIFVRGTTEAINLVAQSWGAQHVGMGDEIIVSHLEHHANIVPWQQLASAKGAKLRVIPVDDSGQVLLDEYQKLLSERTKIVAVTQVSNALGTVVPVKEIVAMAHRAGAKVLVDGAQSVSHMRVDVQEMDADFFVFSGHKVFGPTGIGVLWGKRAVLEDMPPWQGGGNMIADVTFEKTVFQPIPNKFEAGTGNIADAVGLGAAIDYITRLGIENIARYEHELLCYGMQQLAALPGVRLIGTAANKTSVMSFTLQGYSTDEVGKALNQEGIAVRTGHHCAQPILRRMGVQTTVRPSLAFYNTFEEIDRLVAVVRRLGSARPR